MLDKIREECINTWRDVKASVQSEETRQLLLWCLPALLAGLIFRGILMWQMPHGFFHDDTRFVLGPAMDVTEGKLDFSGRRPYLVPMVYAIPILLHLPFLSSVAIFQHFLGLVLIVAVGALSRMWFKAWRWIIIPLTLIMALNPVLLWYEHTALPEYMFIFSALIVALIGTWFMQKPTLGRFAIFFMVLFLNAGARPEANLLYLFGMMAVARAYWKQWRTLAIMVPVAIVLSGIGVKLTQTSQGGKLLLTTLLPMIPEKLWLSPGFGERIEPLRTETQEHWEAVPHSVNDTRKRLSEYVETHLVAEKLAKKDDAADYTDSFCRKVALETLARAGFKPAMLAYRKFRNSLHDRKLRSENLEIPSGTFGPEYLYDEQTEYIYTAKRSEWGSSMRYTELYFGKKPSTPKELDDLLHERYVPFTPDWLTAYQISFYRWFFDWATEPKQYKRDSLPGLPYVYPLAVLGLILASFSRPPRILNAQQLWVISMFLLAFAVFLSGNMISRYRLPFELSWWIGLLAWIEVLLVLVPSLVGAAKPPLASGDKAQ